MSAFKKGKVYPVRVERVIDGDTVRVRRGGWLGVLFPGASTPVRLYGMDAPESEQRYGDQSTRALRKLLRGGGWRMEVMDTDRYQRVVGLLYQRSRERSANLVMVEQGWAHAYVRYGGRELGMEPAEGAARRKRVGMWRGSGPREAPEVWRRRQRERSSRWARLKTRLLAILLLLVAAGAAGYWYFWS